MDQTGFDTFYRGFFHGRWDALRSALLEDPKTQAFVAELIQPYFLDEASVAAADALGVVAGDEVLDLCAAPGGKSLVLAVAMGPTGHLTANDRSSSRRARLRRVLADHLPAETLQRVRVTPHDASKWGLYEHDRYDRVLVDVPCSSERHLLRSPAHLAKWTPARTRHLALQAYAMLAAAVTAARPGGTILYSTCTISAFENDDVVRKLFAKRGEIVVLDPLQAPCGEPTDFGWQILPDRCKGRGPIYFARLIKHMSNDAVSPPGSVDGSGRL